MSDSTNSGIADVQRKTPAWARGMSVARWTAENGVAWDKAAASAIADQWQAELAAAARRKGRAA